MLVLVLVLVLDFSGLVYPGPVLVRLRPAELLAATYALVLAGLALAVSDPTTGEALFRGYFIQDADEVVRSWYGRCAFENKNVIPFSHLSMPGWTAVLAVGEGLGRLLGLPLTLPGRLFSVLAAWTCLWNAAGWVRRVGGDDRAALIVVALLAVSPGFFLLALTVYPEMTLLALTVAGLRFLAEDRFRAAALVVAWAPLVRWEGALLWALFALALGVKAFRNAPGARVALLLLALPYGAYLGITAARWGNPWTPLAWRTTKYMGAWRLFNPDVPWERLRQGIGNLVTLYTPAVLGLGLPVAAMALVRHRPLVVAALAFGGLNVAMLSIQHDFMVYPLRVFVVPLGLGVLVIVGVASRVGSRWRTAILWAATFGTAWSIGATVRKIAETPVPPPGRFREEIGFHALVPYADAGPARDWLLAQQADWILVNHLNANLLRADETCHLYEKPLWIGGPNLALSREFEPSFGLPPGSGLLVFHALPIPPPGCVEAARFDESHQSIYRCGAP